MNNQDNYLNFTPVGRSGDGQTPYHQQQQKQQQQAQTTIRTQGPSPRTLHVAHRRSPSELTTLMLEQLNLQRQLEVVQAQQQQILQQQQQQQLSTQAAGSAGSLADTQLSLQALSLGAPVSQSPRTSPSPRLSPHHRRSSSSDDVYDSGGSVYSSSSQRGHRRSQSSASSRQQAIGHSRRHSLGLSEARRAAAEAQAQRGLSPSRGNLLQQQPQQQQPLPQTKSLAPPSFKFPASPTGSGNGSNMGGNEGGHRRTRSAFPSVERSPQRGFQFPARDTDLLAPPQPNYRSNNGGYHRQTGSDFTPGHSRNKSSYGGSTSSITQFQSGRKSLFAPYLPQNSLPELIADGRLVTGTLRVNKKNRSDAYVSSDDGTLDSDIFICGSKDRNRALEGDIVAVELLVVDEVWSSKREKEEKKRKKDRNYGNNFAADGNADVHNDASTGKGAGGSLSRRGSLKQRPTQKKNDDVEVEGQSLLLTEEEEISDEQKPLYAGHIVAVIDRIPGQLFSGTLGLLRPSQASKDKKDNKDGKRAHPKIVWFKPTDKKVPLIAIPTEQAPRDFVEHHDKYANQIFVASIKRWPITSLHPFGTLVSQLGSMDNPQVEVCSILRDNNFQGDEYVDRPEYYLSELSAFDGTGRRDLGSEYVLAFSENGKHSDHAVHVKVVSPSRIELGIHIADVAHYVLRDSELDKRARQRSHGVFLPQSSVGLFPDEVAETISFKAGRPQLALSVIFEIDSSSFEFSDVWMGETVVTPAQRVTYAEVDKMLSDPSQAANSATAGYVATLELISARLRKKRLGDTELDAHVMLPLLYQLDDETVRPTLNIYEAAPSVSLVSELFHAVNSAVAQRTHSGIGSRALLRKYPMPPMAKFETYVSKVRQLGIDIDTTNGATFHDSLLRISDPVKRGVAETLLAKCMPKGKYVVAGQANQSVGHYLFNSASYTNFTSPMRRYTDLVVARQLKAVLSGRADWFPESADTLKVICEYCNFKKDCARSAQEQAIHLLLCQAVHDMSRDVGQVLCTGVVLQVYESAFDVYLPEFGIEKRVHGDQLPLRKAEYDKAKGTLSLYWEPGADSATYVPEDENGALSYRASIKNKYRAPIKQAAEQQEKAIADGDLVTPAMKSRLAQMGLHAPELSMAPGNNTLEGYLKLCDTRVDGDDHIQSVKVLDKVPILLRAEIGMALPCLTVRTANPF